MNVMWVISMMKLLAFWIALMLPGLISAGQEIVLWHSFDGPLEQKFTEIINRFNQKSQVLEANVKITPYYKGTYKHTLAAGLTVLNKKEAPHILQVYEGGSLVMLSHPKAYRPLNQLTEKPSPLLNPEHFIPIFSAFYKSRHGEDGLQSLPFSASTVVLFYNKDALRKAGLDPEQPPETWEVFEKIAQVLKTKDAKHILASGWLTGHNLDQLGAWHNEPIATKGNGVDGDNAKLVVNRPFFIDHLNKLSSWYQMGLFSMDTGKKAEEAFAKGEVIFLTHAPNRLAQLEKLVNGQFDIGVGYLPFWEKAGDKVKVKAPQNTVAGSASFFALAGHAVEDYVWVEQFFVYLTSPEIQAKWHQDTCYLPVTKDAMALTKKQNFYEKSLKGRVAKVALDSVARNKPKEYSRGILLPQFTKVREMMVQEMKQAITGRKTGKEALDQMVILGNQIMQEGNVS